jgi:hypothetical protein
MRFAGTVCAFLMLIGTPVLSGGYSGRVRIQVGQEYDTNVERIYAETEKDVLTRVVLEGDLKFDWRQHHASVNYHGGFKAFYHHSSENLVVTKLVGTYAWTGMKPWLIGGRQRLHSTYLDLHDRDYLLCNGEMFLRRALFSWLQFEVFLGYRYFYFLPDDYMDYTLKFSHVGPITGARLVFSDKGGLLTTLQYQADVRFFDHPALFFKESENLVNELEKNRLDVRHTIGIRLRRPFQIMGQPRLIAEASYSVLVNDTNSYGSAAVWHRVRLVLSARLPLRLTLHVMGTLQFTGYNDGIFFDSDNYDPDADENENSLVVRLSVPVWEGLSAFVHGAIYRNEFTTDKSNFPEFQRETIMAGLAYDVDF